MDVFDEIKNRIDLVGYLSETVELRKHGRTFKGLCPFHSEKTPSFIVYPDTQDFHCFGCGAHGTVIDFTMEMEKLNLWETAEFLADRIGIPIQQNEHFIRTKQEYTKREKIAEKKHQEIHKGMEYLRSRGLNEEIAKEFSLGWSDKNQSLIIPIHDKYGRTAGFSERYLEPGQGPKYKNSQNDEVFNKAELLFNLHRARKHIKDRLYVVEGYFDVMSLWKMGEKAVIGVNRDSLTHEQTEILRGILSKDVTIVLIPDRDKTGIQSVERNKNTLRRFCKNYVSVLLVPEGCKDANDALVNGQTIDEWHEESADMFLLKSAMDEEKSREKQYMIAKDIANQAANDMVKADMVDYLSELWGKEKKLVQEYIGSKNDGIQDKLSKIYGIDELWESYTEYVKNENKFIVTLGYPKLNQVLSGGVRPGEVLQFIARSGVGKTTWMINVIHNILVYQQIPIIFFSLEQQKEPVFEILLQIAAKKHSHHVKDSFKIGLTDEYYARAEKMKQNFKIIDEGGLTLSDMEEMVNLADMYLFNQPSRAIFVDYLGYIKHRSSNSYERTTEVAKELKELAKRTNKAVFSLHQTSREGEGGWKQVTMTMARDSGAVEESADYMLGAWRPGLDPDLSLEEKESMENDYLINVMKNRRGPANRTLEFKYYAETRLISE